MNITNSEWKIMKCLWEKPMTITQLSKVLQKENDWKKNTVITLLKRMEEKGSVYYEQGVRAKTFFPNCKKEDIQLEVTEDFLKRVFDGDRALMLQMVFAESKPTTQELNEICKTLNLQKKKK